MASNLSAKFPRSSSGFLCLRLILLFTSVSVPCREIAAQADLSDREAVLMGQSLNDAAAAALELNPSAKPDNASGFELLGYYWSRSIHSPSLENSHKFALQMEWAITNAPDSPALRSRSLHFQFSDFPAGGADYPRIVALWNQQIASHPGNTAILHNAVMSLFAMPISVAFADQLRKLDPYDVAGVVPCAMALGSILIAVEDGPAKIPETDNLAKIARFTISQFDSSKDAALVGTTGRALVDLHRPPGAQDKPSAQQGARFLQRAQQIDPANPKWKETLSVPIPSAPGDTFATQLYRAIDEEDLWPGRLVPSPAFPGNPVEVSTEDAWLRQYMYVFGKDVSTAALALPGVHKDSRPEVPSQVDGEVKLDLLIDENGRILRAVPLSGDADHIEISEEVTDRWRFHPWLVNEKPVAFHSVITIYYRKSLWGPIGGTVGAVSMLPTLRIGGDEPVYPAVARAARVQGVVVLKVIITEKGSVEDLSVMSGPPLLQKAALDAVRTWIYKPFMRDGKTVRVTTQVNVDFRLPPLNR